MPLRLAGHLKKGLVCERPCSRCTPAPEEKVVGPVLSFDMWRLKGAGEGEGQMQLGGTAKHEKGGRMALGNAPTQ
jgi:hypothetical protein